MRRSFSSLAILTLVSACGSDSPVPATDAGSTDAPDLPREDAPALPTEDAPAPLTDAGSTDAPRPMGGSIFGGITRTAMPAAGGVGDLYIALFTSDPVISGGSAMPVANARIEGADMRAPDVRIPYEVNGIPPRAEPYFVVAFLDDNGTVDPTDPAGAGPDRGDLVSLMGVGSVRVTVPDEGAVPLDLVLNFNLPF